MNDGSCDGCYFALPTVTDDKDVLVKCRRFPPAVFVKDGELWQAFPDAEFRCGEYVREETLRETLKNKRSKDGSTHRRTGKE